MFNNELEGHIYNLTSQIPILSEKVETIDTNINKTTKFKNSKIKS